MSVRRSLLAIGAAATLGAIAAPAPAFIISTTADDPWLTTASGSRPGNGAPAVITWSVVPDGTQVLSESGLSSSPSNLNSFLTSTFSGTPGLAAAQQPWFSLLTQSFGRWEELGGVDFSYQAADDAVLLPSEDGVLGTRADIRLGGMLVDGDGGTLAFTYLPSGGSDMVIDTGDADFFGDAADGFRAFRNTVMHELGHAFGILHVNSGSQLLMEPSLNTAFDGPQLDEVRGIHYFFGDVNEKADGGLGNGIPQRATSLGTIVRGSTRSVGASANRSSQVLQSSDVDFVSITGLADQDYFSFSVTEASLLDASLTPLGGVFTQAGQGQTPTTFDASARNDLSLAIYDANGTTLLATASGSPVGAVESLSNLRLPAAGTYFARVSGATLQDTVQLYQLSLSAKQIVGGDFDENGVVDGLDLARWTNGLGLTSADHSQGDADANRLVDGADLLIWQRQLGSGVALEPVTAALPEPGALAAGMAQAGGAAAKSRRRQRRTARPSA